MVKKVQKRLWVYKLLRRDVNYVLPTDQLLNNISKRNAIFMQYSDNLFGSPSKLSLPSDAPSYSTFSQSLQLCRTPVNPLKQGLDEEEEEPNIF